MSQESQFLGKKQTLPISYVIVDSTEGDKYCDIQLITPVRYMIVFSQVSCGTCIRNCPLLLACLDDKGCFLPSLRNHISDGVLLYCDIFTS